MRYVDEYRNRDDLKLLSEKIFALSRTPVSLMEVCGGHTMSIHRFGIPSLLPDTITLISGPGCPVCVTPVPYVDRIIALSRMNDVIIATYGDFLRVPGSTSTLERERAAGCDIRIIYSTMDALDIAVSNRDKTVIFPAIGFETTSPATAAAIIEAGKRDITNFKILSSHKTMPAAMSAIIDDGVRLNGYICPGHVTVVAGTDMYKPIAENYKLPCVVSGFEPADIMMAIFMLVRQIENGDARVEIAYTRAVKPEGNPVAMEYMKRVFSPRDDEWRGLGIIPASGLALKSDYSHFDAANIQVEVEISREPAGCICGQILKGINKPSDCLLFGKACTPENPIGACMVSSEGSCAAHYRYDSEK